MPSSAPQPTSSREARLAKLRKAAEEIAVGLKGVEAPIDARDLVEACEIESAEGAPAAAPAKVPRAMLLKGAEAPKVQPAPEAPAAATAKDDGEDWVADVEHDETGQKAKRLTFSSSKGKKWGAEIERNEKGKTKRIVFKRGK